MTERMTDSVSPNQDGNSMDRSGSRKPAAKRKPHRKSRTGCKQCRASRVKCDESKPSCSYCIRHSVDCSYLSTEPPSISSLNLTSRNESPRRSSGPSSNEPSESSAALCSNLHMKDLELLLHFNTITGPSISSVNPKNVNVWSSAVPEEALKHPFLMHGLFAIAALHISYLSHDDAVRKEEYALLAAKHENIALPLFRTEADDITEHNCAAVFAFAALVVVYAMASPNHSGARLFPSTAPGSSQDPMATHTDVLPEWLHLLRGVDAITRTRHKLFQNSPLAPLIDLNRFNDRMLNPTDEIYLSSLSNLFAVPEPSPTSSHIPERNPDTDVYLETLGYLRNAFTTPASPHMPMQPVPYIFFTFVSERFLQLLRQRQPEALILLAYECVILKRLEPLWFLDGVADRLMKTVITNLGLEWRPWVEWPLREMGLNGVW